jgi:hypothetical protein
MTVKPLGGWGKVEGGARRSEAGWRASRGASRQAGGQGGQRAGPAACGARRAPLPNDRSRIAAASSTRSTSCSTSCGRAGGRAGSGSQGKHIGVVEQGEEQALRRHGAAPRRVEPQGAPRPAPHRHPPPPHLDERLLRRVRAAGVVGDREARPLEAHLLCRRLELGHQLLGQAARTCVHNGAAVPHPRVVLAPVRAEGARWEGAAAGQALRGAGRPRQAGPGRGLLQLISPGRLGAPAVPCPAGPPGDASSPVVHKHVLIGLRRDDVPVILCLWAGGRGLAG